MVARNPIKAPRIILKDGAREQTQSQDTYQDYHFSNNEQ